jgi:hypothetical protein
MGIVLNNSLLWVKPTAGMVSPAVVFCKPTDSIGGIIISRIMDKNPDWEK